MRERLSVSKEELPLRLYADVRDETFNNLPPVFHGGGGLKFSESSSLETLELRLDRMCRTAGIVADRLAAHPAPRAVRYPGLPADPGHNLAARQMLRPGFLIGLTLASGEAAEAFIAACPFLRPATSFGGVHSSAERRDRWGDAVAPGFVRLAIGCEPAEELWAALEGALPAGG